MFGRALLLLLLLRLLGKIDEGLEPIDGIRIQLGGDRGGRFFKRLAGSRIRDRTG